MDIEVIMISSLTSFTGGLSVRNKDEFSIHRLNICASNTRIEEWEVVDQKRTWIRVEGGFMIYVCWNLSFR
jgi:hypothetical protein